MNNFNIIGTWTLYLKEVRRFLKVYNQTLLAPVITSLLFLAVFKLAIGTRVHNIGGVSFEQFMAAGLVIMAVVQNSFANSSSSLTMGKVLGTIGDYLTPPISAFEMSFAMVAAAMTRGIAVGVLVSFAVSFFIPLNIHSWFFVVFYLLLASCLLGLLGLLAGILAETFDQMAAITSYVITPLSFLSGTFYSVKQLPEIWYNISQFNPFFFMIDGFRYGLTGYSDGNLQVGMAYLLSTNIILWLVIHLMLKKGYRIKS